MAETELRAAEIDPAALAALLAELAAAPDDPRAALARALFRADEVVAVFDPAGAGAMMRQALAPYGGVWRAGALTGRLESAGWGAALGLQGVRWDPAAAEIPVQTLRAPTLPAAWGMLDAFAVGDYRRILAPVRLEDGGLLVANFYALK